MIIDTHCHIDLYKNPYEVLQECEVNNITVLAVTNLPTHFEIGYNHILPFKRIRLALGLHPLNAADHKREFPCFVKNISKTSYVGEVGLDFSREGFATKDIQLKSFVEILKLISGKKKILSLHSRRAEKEVLELLLEYKIKNAIFHWYSGPLFLIDEIVAAGYFFSINTAMIKSDNGKKIISRIPQTHLLTETDGPFILENDQPVTPKSVSLVIDYLSKERLKTIEQVEELINENFKRLISGII